MSEFLMILLPLLLLFSLIGTGVFLTLQLMERKKRIGYQEQVEQSKSQYGILEKRASALDAAYQTERTKHLAYREELKKVIAARDALKSNLQDLITKLQHYADNAHRLSDELSRVTAHRDELRAGVNSLDSQVKNSNDRISELEQENTSVKSLYQQLDSLAEGIKTDYQYEFNARKSLLDELAAIKERNARLEKWSIVADAEIAANELQSRAMQDIANSESMANELEAKARQRLADAESIREQAHIEAERTLQDARQESETIREQAKIDAEFEVKDLKKDARDIREKAENSLNDALVQSEQIIKTAELRAHDIAESAWEVKQNASFYVDVVRAMTNRIEGYGDQYISTIHSLLDDLAEQWSHKEAGIKLKKARDFSRRLVKQGFAVKCEYVVQDKKATSERFVLDAFDWKVDSILERAKSDNFGKLCQEMKDACILINYNGQALRNARITDGYMQSRLEELKWAVVVQQLKEDERLEQRRIREQIREEEKALKEFERARKEAEKEEGTLREAMAKAQAEIDRATEAQRGEYEQKLAELSAKLKEAEERGQRAISMAQQTRRGHVYIISNTGSLGENVYKIGLTRRLEPQERIDELGDASVPFSFDVHAIIFSEDAPELERRLHRHFVLNQINKVNHRKEFFRTDLAHIRNEIEGLGVQASWTMMSEAAEYRESQAIEKRIAEDPTAKEAWMNRQLIMEVAEPNVFESDAVTDNKTVADEEILNRS